MLIYHLLTVLSTSSYYDDLVGVESGNAKSRVVCGYFLAILQPIRTFSPKLLQGVLFGGLLIGCVLLCFCVAEISGAVINNNCTIGTISLIASL